jgi:RNA-directed DNA polymerase
MEEIGRQPKMKRFGNLFEMVVSWPNMVLASRRARNRKRRRESVARFEFDVEFNLSDLRHELIANRYVPGPYKTFEIFEPKLRQISAAPYRDRVIHHAICNVVEPILDKAMIDDSYACRTGKGTHSAVLRARQYAKRFRYVLKADIKKYFPSIDHGLLKKALRTKIKDRRVLELLDQIIDHSNPQESRIVWFPGDDLFTPSERRRGLPIGNLTSQLFANWMLNDVDRFVKQDLRVAGYVRYCDDMLLFGDDSKQLAEFKMLLKQRLADVRLELHPTKSVIYRTDCGFPFLGYRLLKRICLIDKRNVHRFRRRMRDVQRQFAEGSMDHAAVQQRIMSWIGHVCHTDSALLVRKVLSKLKFHRLPQKIARPAGDEDKKSRGTKG